MKISWDNGYGCLRIPALKNQQAVVDMLNQKYEADPTQFTDTQFGYEKCMVSTRSSAGYLT